MKIAVIGTGNVGRPLGLRAARAGHQVRFGSREPQSEKCRDLAESEMGVAVSGWSEAAADAELILLAVPWSAAREAVASCGDFRGQVLVDCINALKPDLSGLDLGEARSAAEQIQAWAVGARVVKAFNTVSAATMHDPHYDGLAATLFYCGDDEQAKSLVAQLAADLEFEPVDAGPLANAAYLESLAMLYIQLAIRGWGSNCAFKMLKRDKPTD